MPPGSRGSRSARSSAHRLFWGRAFRVTRDVLDPRPETEMLVAAALAAPVRGVLDLGTGIGLHPAVLSGGTADGARGLASMCRTAALAVATRECSAPGPGRAARFLQSDWFAAVAGPLRSDRRRTRPISRPAEMAGLSPEVRDWEPHLALTPGGDGLDAYRAIAAGASAHLLSGRAAAASKSGRRRRAAVAALFAARRV